MPDRDGNFKGIAITKDLPWLKPCPCGKTCDCGGDLGHDNSPLFEPEKPKPGNAVTDV